MTEIKDVDEEVVIVTPQDEVLGTMPKMQAHHCGALHRAVSVFLFTPNGEWLLQQRAATKYHSPLLWSNSCCTHPRLNEGYADAAHRRVGEELGITSPLHGVSYCIYRAEMDHEMVEHELDHLFVGVIDRYPKLNPDEVAAFWLLDYCQLDRLVREHPNLFTEWFKIIFEQQGELLQKGNLWSMRSI